MNRFTDLMELKNDRARDNAIRERVARAIFDYLTAELGAEYTRYIDKEIGITENMTKVGKDTVVADVGDVLDADGCPLGACVEITVKVKRRNTVVTKSGDVRYAVTLDDYPSSNEG